MKRFSNLFEKAFSEEALYYAYLSASKGKRKTKSWLNFTLNLGVELFKLREEIFNETYSPRPYRELIIHTPKKREILAPNFRDVVIQHAIYAMIYPIFNKTFISTSFACRVGKGTHAASNNVYYSMKTLSNKSFTLHLDIRKYFTSIDQDILKSLLQRKIKDKRLLRVMFLFCKNGIKKRGIPLGNLLSQLYALIYLNPVDHFIKRVLKIKHYTRYVDDMIILGINNLKEMQMIRDKIKEFLKELKLEFSKYTLRNLKHGINFVGFRTWKTHRLIRKYSFYKFKKAIQKNNIPRIMSILGHAKNTSSIKKMFILQEC